MLWGRKTWRTPDAALGEVFRSSVLGARAIDYSRIRVQSSNDDLAEVVDAHSRVMAIVGQFEELEQALLIGYGLGLGYQRLSEVLHVSRTTCRRKHQRARVEFIRRMLEHGLLSNRDAAV